MGLLELYNDYNIDIAEPGHRHYRSGWINSECPHCSGTSGYHLGFNEEDKYYSCHRCGYHPIIATLSLMLGVSNNAARDLSRRYEIYTAKEYKREKKNPKINVLGFSYPRNSLPLKRPHRQYLIKRNFDPDYLEKKFGLLGTGPVGSSLDDIQYNYRIIAPIYWKGKVVSFQSRDYTGKQEKRYLACPMRREIIHHKHIIYGLESTWQTSGIAVEGIFDVYRFVKRTFCVFGIEYTDKQVYAIAKLFKRVFTLFDPERQAQRQAKKLGADLKSCGVEVINVKLNTDPGDMDPKEAKYLLKQLK